MGTLLMKEFRVIHEDGKANIAVYANARQAIAAFDTEQNPVAQLVRTRIGIQVGVPDALLDVKFRTVIGGEGAETAGCWATPSSFEVPDNTSVIFEAFAAPGYNFIGWYIGSDTSGEPEATSLITSITIDATLGVSQDVIITALFAPIG